MIRYKIQLSLILFLIIVLSQPLTTIAKEVENKNHLILQTSILTHHWSQNPKRNNQQDLIGLEYQLSNSSLYGLSYFQNSYSQPTWYIYTGKLYYFKEISNCNLYGKLTYGIISGYDDENGRYPALINEVGTFPALLPSLGIKSELFSVEISFFANAGYIITCSLKFK